VVVLSDCLSTPYGPSQREFDITIARVFLTKRSVILHIEITRKSLRTVRFQENGISPPNNALRLVLQPRPDTPAALATERCRNRDSTISLPSRPNPASVSAGSLSSISSRGSTSSWGPLSTAPSSPYPEPIKRLPGTPEQGWASKEGAAVASSAIWGSVNPAAESAVRRRTSGARPAPLPRPEDL
jgi:hypothetical protein